MAMMQATRILSVVALILLFVNYKKTGKHMEGLKSGLGTIVSIITGWSLLGLLKAPYEIAFFGSKFFISRMLYSIPFCLAAGLIAHLVEVLIL